METVWDLQTLYGSYLTIGTGVDRSLTGIGGQRANQILADPYGDKSAGPFTNYLNLAAFAQPNLGTLGNMGRNNVIGPGTWQFDMSLSREFQIRENQKLEFRAEAYTSRTASGPSIQQWRSTVIPSARSGILLIRGSCSLR